MKKLKKFLFPILITVVLIAVVSVIFFSLQSKPIGGEIYAPDFKNGYEIYVEDSYTVEDDKSEEPHSLWCIDSEDTKTLVYKSCQKIKQYREFSIVADVLFGDSSQMITNFPTIYIDTGRFGYRIEILNWDNYEDDEIWSLMRIRNELYGSPVLHVWRIDLSEKPNEMTTYTYLKEYTGLDTMNTEENYGWGWYSTLSQDDLDNLLSHLKDINNSNATAVEVLYD